MYMSDQGVFLSKWPHHRRIILAKEQLGHSYIFWTMSILIFCQFANFGNQSLDKMLIISQILWIRDCLDKYCLYNPTGLLVYNNSITFCWSWWRYNVFRRALSKDFWFLYCLMLYVPCRKIFLLPYCNLIQCL